MAWALRWEEGGERQDWSTHVRLPHNERSSSGVQDNRNEVQIEPKPENIDPEKERALKVHYPAMSSHDPQALKAQFIAQHGIWSPQWASLLALDPSYFAAYLQLRAAASKGQHITPKFQELIHLSVASVVSIMFHPGIEAHTRAALDAGATKEEILEVLALTSVCGIHSISCGLPVLMEVLAEQGMLPERPEELDERRQELKDDFHRKRGYWGKSWDNVLAFDPDFFEAYTQFSAEPFREGKNNLSAKEKELIYCAFDACATHMYTPGLKLHMQNAIRYGATPEELMQVLELASLIGVHTLMVGAEVLERTLNMRGA